MATAADSSEKVRSLVKVAELISSRYSLEKRPESWDERRAGADVVRTEDGRVLNLQSDGGQSPPKKGWSLVLTGGDSVQGYTWTLYGMSR